MVGFRVREAGNTLAILRLIKKPHRRPPKSGRSCPDLPRRIYNEFQLMPLLVPGEEIAGRY
jgi:hypothetical protein